MTRHSAPLPDEPPSGCSWGRYLQLLVAAHGGWVPLVDILQHRARGVVEVPADPQTVERGLRRLAARGSAPGGKYGRWLLRFFGVPAPLAQVARWMGCYHSRFADLPLTLRLSQLQLWDRPPICESQQACWIHLGLASVAMRQRDPHTAAVRLAKAMARSSGAGPAAIVESKLLEARLASDRGDQPKAAAALACAEQGIVAIQQPDERDCYRARWVDQRAYRLLHPVTGERDVAAAEALYRSLSDTSQVAFARFRRAHGLAYCSWKQGEQAVAIQQAHEAAEHAADGGFMRFRVMALTLRAHIEQAPEGHPLHLRAQRMVQLLEHEDLLNDRARSSTTERNAV